MTGPDDHGRRPPGEEDGSKARSKGNDAGLSDLASSYRKAAPIVAASTQLVVSVGLFTFLGWWGDQKLGHRVPWLMLVGAVVGVTGGFVNFFKTVLNLGKSDKK